MFKLLLIATILQQAPSDTIPLIDSNKILKDAYGLMSEEQYDSALLLLQTVHPEDSNYNAVSYRMASCYLYSDQAAKAV